MEGSELSALYEKGTVWPMGTVSFLDQEGCQAASSYRELLSRRQKTSHSRLVQFCPCPTPRLPLQCHDDAGSWREVAGACKQGPVTTSGPEEAP